MVISYKPLFRFLIDNNIDFYKMCRDLNIKRVNREHLKRDEPIKMDLLSKILDYLDCEITDIIELKGEK